jgi:hypothetical protein
MGSRGPPPRFIRKNFQEKNFQEKNFQEKNFQEKNFQKNFFRKKFLQTNACASQCANAEYKKEKREKKGVKAAT